MTSSNSHGSEAPPWTSWGQAVESFKMELDNLLNCLCDNGCLQWRDSTSCFKGSFLWFDLRVTGAVRDPCT